MATINWQNAVNGYWYDATLWSTGTVPGAGDSAVVSVDGSYTISVTASIDVGAVAITDTGAMLAISSPYQPSFVTGDFINLGTLAIDTNFGEGGSTLVIGGTLGNANIVQIGPGASLPGLTAPTTVTAGELANTGSIVLYGGQTNQATLNITSDAPTIINGLLALYNNSLLQFEDGEITSIAAGSEILLYGADARVADADSPDSSSALTGLAISAGDLELQNGASLAISGNFSNDGVMDIDAGGQEGGSALTIDGTLFNSGLLQIGSSAEDPTASTTVTVDYLAIGGMVQLFGGSGTDTNQSALDVTAMAPSVLEGAWSLTGEASITFGSGQITAIAGNGDLLLDGPVGFIADAGSPGSDSAVALSSNAGILELENGAALTITGNLDNTGTINVDEFSSGGSTLTVDGTLTNEGSATVNIGSPYYTPTAPSALDVTGVAPSVLEGAWSLTGEASITFGSGQITAIAANGDLLLNGPVGFIADAGSPGSDSAVALSSNGGILELRNGSTLTTTGNLDNTGTINVDEFSSGGSTLTVDGTLTNDGSATVNIGSPYYTPTAPSALDVSGVAPGALEGNWNLTGEASITFGSGQITAIAANGDLLLNGPVGFIADAGSPGSDSAVALSSNAGILELRNGATLTTTGNLDNTGTINVDEFSSGGSTLTVDGTLTNEGSATVNIGSPYYTPTAPSALDVTGMAPAVLEGDWTLTGEASITFGSGQITAIAANGDLLLNGPVGFIADAGSPGSDSAVALSSNAGILELRNGATLTTTGNLDNTGTINVDEFSSGGSTLTVDGTLTNEGSATVNIGSPYYTPTAPSALDVSGVAPGALEGNWSLTGEASITFGSGQITAIAANGDLLLDGPVGFIADAGSPGSDSAVALSSNAGILELRNGATLTTTGNLDNTGMINVDEFSSGGSTLTIDGTLTNESGATVNIGSPYYTATAPSTLDVTGAIDDAGSLTLTGEAVLIAGSLNVDSGNSVTGAGLINAGIINNNGTITVSGGSLTIDGPISGIGALAIAGGATLVLGNSDAEAVSFGGNVGTLRLDVPSRFSGEITGLTAGDTIDLTGLAATSTAIVGSSLIITTAGAQTFTYQISGTLVGTSFQIQSDGAGGSDLALTSQTSQIQPYDNFYTAVDALATDISDNAPSDQITTDAVNVYTAAIAGAIGTIGNAAWQQAYTASSIAAATVGNDLADGQTGSNLLADTLGLYNTIIAGAAGSIAGGVSQTNYVSISQAAGMLSTDILSGASNSQLQGDLANLYSALTSATPNAADPSGWQAAQNASNQALATLSNDIGSGAGTSQILSDISDLYDTILSGSLGAIGGASLQAAYAGGAQTLAGLGGDIVNGASAGNIQGDVEGTYNSIVSAVSSGTSASALENYGSITEAAETLLSQLGTFSTSNLYNDASSLFSTVVSTQPVTLSVLGEIVAAAGSSILNINSIEASLQPPSIDSTDWSLIADRLSSQLGDTTQSLLTALSQAATTLAQIGETTTDVATLLDYELEQASDTLPNITLADTTDLGSAGSALDLSLTRTYSASLLSRNEAGPFGDGWTFAYDIDAVTDPSGDVYITSPSGTEVFTLQADGTYTAELGDSSTLAVVDGAYVLTNIDGTVEEFLPDGQISSITDSNGDGINISYGSNGVISEVTSSNGQSLTFTSNAQGQITSATNQDGQQTIYSYDASGDQLISVSGPDGVTTYTYASNGNPFTQNALTEITNPDGTTETFQYDSTGNLISEFGSNGAGQIDYSYPSPGTVVETNASGDADTLIFGVNGNLAENIDALGNVTQYEYNSTGELTGVVTPTGGTSTYSYDTEGNLSSYTDADGGTVSTTYVSGTDLLSSLTDQDGNTTTYSYNSAGDLTGVTYANGDGTSYQYSANGLLTSSTDALGQTTTYTYNYQDLLTQESFSDGTYQAYTYDALGELTSAQATNGGVTTYAYNPAGDLTSVTNPAGQVESYTYNSAGQELTRTEPDGSVTQYIYNSNGQLAEIQDGSGNLITQYTYDPEGQLIGSLDGNGQTTSYTYDADGEVTQILTAAADGSVTSDLTYTYNSDGLPSTATSSDGTWAYTYDADGQLTNAVFASTNPSIPDQDLTYEYDAAGNRTETIFNGAINNYTTNGLNQYTASDGTTYDYDADGNLVSVTQNGATTTYTYNSQNQLIAVSGPSGDYTYQYDALGNVASSTDNGVVTNYIIDPLAIDTSATGPLSAIAQAYDAAGNVTATYDYGDGLAAEITNAGTDYYNTDAAGNVVSLSGANGVLVDTYEYSPFGTLLGSSGDVANLFQFAGGWGATTGADGLVDMRARYYDATTGRFLSQDPVGIEGGANLYTHADNSPTDLTDPTGLNPIVFAALGGGLANAAAEVAYEGATGGNFNAANIGGAFVGGALGGVVGVFNPAAGAFVNGAASSIAKDLFNGKSPEWGEAGLNGALNLTTGSPKFGLTPKQSLRAVQGLYAGYFKPFLNGTLGKIPANVAADFLAEAMGDVHLESYDGLLYDFQAAGEFVLTQSTLPGDSFQVQVRLQPWGSSSSVSVITQVAAGVGSERVTIGLGRSDPVWVDGSAVTFSQADPTIALADGTITQLTPSSWQVNWNTGEAIQVSDSGSFLDVSVALGANDGPGSVEGLLGPDEGQANDFQLPNGTVLPQPLAATDLYGEYADAWRVTQASSLLDYEPGETTATFTDPEFPTNVISLSDLPPSLVQEAEQLLAQLNDPPGVPSDPIDPGLEQAAILDYLATGDQSFLTSALNLNQEGVTTTEADVTSTSVPTEFGVAAAQPTVTEAAAGATPVTFDVYLTNAETTATAVDYAVVAAGAGYLGASAFGGTLPSGSVPFAAGQTSGQFTIDVPAGALGTDPSDMLEVEVSAPNGEAIFAPTAETTLANNQAEPGPPAMPQLTLLTDSAALTQNGNAYTLALGNVIQGEPLPQFQFAVSNIASASADSLSVDIDATGIGFNVSGDTEPAPIAAGQSYDGLAVGVDTGIYGANSETITITPTDVNASGYSASLSPLTLTITDTVGAPAQATINSSTSITFPTVRVGTSESQTVSVSNSASSPAASLDAALSPSGDATATGTISLLAPGATDDTDLLVGLNTSAGGPQSGIVTLDFSSDTGDGNTAPLPSQDIEVFGTVFREAVASVTPAIFHVGDAITQTLTITNGATNDGYSENLIATVVGTAGSVSASGTPGEITPQGTSTAIVLGLPTDQAGTVGTVTLDFQSDGTGIDGFGPTDLGEQQIPVTIDNYASAAFEDISGGGNLTFTGSDYTLNLGTITQGTSIGTFDVGVVNAASGPADDLSGTFEASASSAFTLSGFTAFSNLAAGEADTDLQVVVDTSSTGLFSETVTLTPTGSNASGFSAALPDETLTVNADVVLCFLAGTQIATPAGNIPVERLDVGDLVLTQRGETRPITWVGKGRVLATRGRRSAATPVIVRKGALADNVPYRDLRVTKGHSLYFDGVLIPVEFLVNHRSILWDDHAQEVQLYHIELASHDVLLADGAPAESYRDDGNRWLFQNANLGWDLPPQEPCAPVLTGGDIVDGIWRRLLERAGPRPSVPLTDDPDLHVLLNGERVDVARKVGGAHVFHLSAVASDVRIISRAAAPAELGLARDPRVLGVAIRRIVVRKGTRFQITEANDDRLTDGFYAFEMDNGFRWTEGDAAIPIELFAGFASPLELVLYVPGTGRYLADEAAQRVA